MPVFISYSHKDREKVELIAGNLLRRRTNVWIDRWELKAGDSIINRVQEAAEGASALLIMLSEASIQSEWCKKELTAALLRELEEKRVVAVPVLLEDCKIPLLLRDKKYADFRSSFDEGMYDLLESVAQFSNPDQSRIQDAKGHLDWATDWGTTEGGNYFINYVIVQVSQDLEMSFVTEILCVLNEAATYRQMKYEEAGIGWIGRTTNSFILLDYAERANEELFLILDSVTPQTKGFNFRDGKSSAEIDVLVKSRKMGNDNGKDQLINITDYFRAINEYVLESQRQPTAAELEAVNKIRSSPW